jgi:polysaccharide biosynthesis/export protein
MGISTGVVTVTPTPSAQWDCNGGSLLSSQVFRMFMVILVIVFFSLSALGEQTDSGPRLGPSDVSQLRSTYVLGPDDQIVIRALEAEEISEKPVRIDSTGSIRMPLIGEVHATGLSVDQLEAEVRTRLSRYYKNPQVAISVVEYHSQPVSVIGAVHTPGVQQLQGQKTLMEVLSTAGGLSPDAGYVIKITRRNEWGTIPLPGATMDSTGAFTVADVRVKELMDAKKPSENILMKPRDVVTVPRAEMVYVMGEVKRPGGFTLHDDERISILQALSLAEGLARTAAPKNAKILRVSGNKTAERTEISVDVRRVLQGRAADGMLQPSDILFIPNNVPKSAAMRAMEAAIGIGTGLAIYRP